MHSTRRSFLRAVLGAGFLCRFGYQELWRGTTGEKLEGEGCSEQMGLLLR